LTISGIVLEQMENISIDVEKIVVGKIIDINLHPENNNLSVCQVDVKDKILQIVCGARNMKVFDKVAVALDGAKLPQIGIIKSKKIGNILSSGMLCSASELGIEQGKSPGQAPLEIPHRYPHTLLINYRKPAFLSPPYSLTTNLKLF